MHCAQGNAVGTAAVCLSRGMGDDESKREDRIVVLIVVLFVLAASPPIYTGDFAVGPIPRPFEPF